MAIQTHPSLPLDPAAERPRAPADKEHRAAIRAGIFLAAALAATALVLLVLGNAHRLFDREESYVVYFPDVDGLKLDSPVRLGGLSVGRVEKITFSPLMNDVRVRVELRVSQDFTSRIRTDSIARVASRGLLGDKTVDISLGSDEGERVVSGGELTAGSGGDISSVLKASSEVVDNVVRISTDVRKAVAAYTDPKLRKEVSGALESLHGILNEVANGQGALHSVIYDPKTASDLTALMASANRTATRLDGAVAKVDGMIEEVRSGTGTAHSLLYGSEGKKALLELSGAATEVATMIKDVKSSKNAAVHELLYGESKALVDDLSVAATSLKNITAKVDKGEGSLGALVNDPTAYEDLKTILGNVKRNRLLRELVRFTVSNRGEFENTGKPMAPVQPEAAR